ncbi:PAS domain S-box-containing protein [Pacificimonas flava]|nr:PAS domain S-box-containing protein [Pacificimonas flava]
MRRSGLHLVHPRDRRATLEAVKTLSAGHALKNFENCLLCRDGSERVFQWNAVPQRDRGEIYCVARDVTDERTDQRLRRDEERAQAVLTELCVRLDPAADPAKLMDRASRLLKTALQAEEVSFSLIANGPDPDRANHDDGTSGDPDAPPVKAGSASRGGSEAEAEPSSLAQAPAARLTHIFYEDGEAIGCLRATSKPSRRWSAGDERLFSSAADYIGDALQTARKEQELREARDRLATLVEGAPHLVWRAVHNGFWTWCGPQWTAFTGQDSNDCRAFGWLDPVHPEDRGPVRAKWAAAANGGVLNVQFRLRNQDTGEYRWFQTRAAPVRDEHGGVLEWLGTCTDIHELKDLQGRQHLLVAELQHRVRNMLSVVRSVFTRTVETNSDIEQVTDHFSGRLEALARTQVIVTRNPGNGVDLESLIRDELTSVAAGEDQVSISGPPVDLPIQSVESMGLVLHELTSNAIKYGGLRIAGGRLDIAWHVERGEGSADRAANWLHLTWAETGVPAVPVEPGRKGFGLELIAEALPYRLGAKTTVEFKGGGIVCTIALPLVDTASVWSAEV